VKTFLALLLLASWSPDWWPDEAEETLDWSLQFEGEGECQDDAPAGVDPEDGP
jgi:hypothetical protein